MNSKTNYWQSLMVVLAAAVALTVVPTAGSAQVILPENAQAVTGMTYGEWSAVWWQYVSAMPVSNPNNPLFDQTGAGCKAAQPNSSPVFFLVGAISGGVATRNECTVPAGKVLFLPLLNFIDIHVPGDGLDTPEMVRQDLLKVIGPTSELHASVDGVPVGNLNPQDTPFHACAGGDPACSSAFSVTLPALAKNLFGVHAGVYAPAVADGFYLMLGPLHPGAHTINFGGQGVFAGSPFSEEITYNLVVKER